MYQNHLLTSREECWENYQPNRIVSLIWSILPGRQTKCLPTNSQHCSLQFQIIRGRSWRCSLHSPKVCAHTRQNNLQEAKQARDTGSAGGLLTTYVCMLASSSWNIHRRTKMWFLEIYQTPTKLTRKSESFSFWLLDVASLSLSHKDFLLCSFTHHSFPSISSSGWFHPSFHLWPVLVVCVEVTRTQTKS